MKTRCRKCNTMFDVNGELGHNTCPECTDKENLRVSKVEEIIKLNPGISIMKVAEETGLSVIKVREYVRKLNA